MFGNDRSFFVYLSFNLSRYLRAVRPLPQDSEWGDQLSVKARLVRAD